MQFQFTEAKDRNQWQEALVAISRHAAFPVFKQGLESALQAIRVANDVKGYENRETAAQALASIIKEFDDARTGGS